ncbi:MAG TPA: LuxR C-terminal-related transcriptional regulator [Candidatus Nanopelagicales bacterium]
MDRSHETSVLRQLLDDALDRSIGRLALISGEAGVGKSALVRSLVADHEGAQRALQGGCDALFTPRPLGPFLDIAQQTGGDLQLLLDGPARPHVVADALLVELSRAPTLLVLEDVHWADEASLDVLTLLARRLGELSLFVVVTYRDDELGPTHPLRIVLGELATHQDVVRLRLAPLSVQGVAELVGSRPIDADDLYGRTGGNPFFVTEVIAAGEEQIPLTVRDAVLARVARLGAPARATLNTVAVFPHGCEYLLLDQLVADGAQQLDECVSSGILRAGVSAVSFRHELARLAVVEDMSPPHRVRLHQMALNTLAAAESPDLARLAHHADAAGDKAAVVRYAPLAAGRASALGAHRQAAEQYARAIRAASEVAPELLGELYDQRAYACYLSGDFPAAVEARRHALEHHRRAGDKLRQGRTARSLSLLLRYEGDIPRAWQIGHEAVLVLEALGPSHDLAMAYCNLSHLGASSEDAEQARRWASTAGAMADQLGDVEVAVYGQLNLATVELASGDPNGLEKSERSLQIALDGGLEEQAGRAYVALTWWSPRGRSYPAADRHVESGLRYCEEHGLDLWRAYLLAYRARAHLDRGRWDDAIASAGLVLRDPQTSPVPRLVALSVVGLVRARRGEPNSWEPLNEAWVLARDTAELQRIEPVAAARAEAHLLAGDSQAVLEATSLALELARTHGASWVRGEMWALRSRAGLTVESPGEVPEPFASELSGKWRQAYQRWIELESPYEAALALAGADEESAVRDALDRLQRMEAQPAAALVARRLRQRGVRGLPRGPRPATRVNPAQLTARELEVLDLVSNGLRNSEIADRLTLSERTVEHHVAAVLRKLGVRSRADAPSAARRLGLPVQHG